MGARLPRARPFDSVIYGRGGCALARPPFSEIATGFRGSNADLHHTLPLGMIEQRSPR